MQRKYLCGLVAACVIAYAHAVYSEGDVSSQLSLSIRLCEKTPDGDQSRILADPTIAATIGRPFSFRVGGAVKAKSGDGELEIGTRVTGKLERTENGMVRLAMTIGMGNVVIQENDPSTDLVRKEFLEIRTVLESGKAKRLECSPNQWCEVAIEEIK